MKSPFIRTSSKDRKPRWHALCVLCVVLFSGTLANAQNLDELVVKADGFDNTLGRIEERYLTPALLESQFRLETRFNDARVAYFLKDYVRASIMFVAVVENPAVRQFDSYRDSLYMLGDSLYQLRNTKAARSFFRQLVDLGPGRYYQESVVRLLEIASSTNDFEGVDELYSRLDSLQIVSPMLSYMRGKTLYRQKKYGDARESFQRAATDPSYAFVARYYEGVAFSAQKMIAPAREVFLSITKSAPTTPADSNVVDLAYLALGRLAYEDGDFDAAVEYYLRLPRTSPSFDRALHELTWALISRGSDRAALRNVDILLLSNPQPTFVPEAKLLMGDLALRLGEHEQARSAYQGVIDTFMPVHQDLTGFIANHDDLDTFFVDLVRRDLEGVQTDYLPPMVSDWAAESKSMASAKVLVQDNLMTQEEIDEAMAAIGEIEALLGSGSAVEAFPHITEGISVGIETESQIIEVTEKLLAYERKHLESTMTADERVRFEQMNQQFAQLKTQYESLPKNRADLRERQSKVGKKFSGMRSELDRVAYDIDTLRVNLHGIETYMRENPLDKMSSDERRKFDDMRAEMHQTILDLDKQRTALQRELDISRRNVGVGDQVATRESALRTQYQQMLQQQSKFLDDLHARAPAEHRANLQRSAQARARLPMAATRLQNFFASMNEIVNERVVEVQKDLDVEYNVLVGYQQELDQLKGTSEETAAALALLNYQAVGRQFEEIILRGNVGLIDVGWKKKETVTTEINQLFENRASELQLLRDAFKDVR